MAMASVEAHRRYREAHRDEINARGREYKRRKRAEDPEAARAAARAYFLANQDRLREYERGRRQRMGPRHVDPEYNWGYRLKHKHRMSPAEWHALWDKQLGRCYLCTDPLPEKRRDVHVDHDHSCCPDGYSCASCRRGLTCRSCNLLIGHAGDDPARLARILENLIKATAG